VILPVFKTGARHLRGVVGGFDSHSLPPFVFNRLRSRRLTNRYRLTLNLAHNRRTLSELRSLVRNYGEPMKQKPDEEELRSVEPTRRKHICSPKEKPPQHEGGVLMHDVLLCSTATA
jgi:hypothetical protein